MNFSIPKFAGVLCIIFVVSGATAGYAQSRDQSLLASGPVVAFAAPQQEEQSAIMIDLMDAKSPLKASLWATHLLQNSTQKLTVHEGFHTESEFEMTGPFLERTAGIRLELNF